MKIWHFGASSSPNKVCGVTRTVWLVAGQQAELGHQVALMVNSAPDRDALDYADKLGIDLIYLPSKRWQYDQTVLDRQLECGQPDIVHMHSVFIPKQATLAQTLMTRSIPYIVTPHGGLDFRRSRWQKIVYSALIEKRRFKQAHAITGLTERETLAISDFVPKYTGLIRLISNPIDLGQFGETCWQQNLETQTTEAKTIVYLGRFDVVHKGLDILGEIARLLPNIRFNLYGSAEAKSQPALDRLKQQLPANVCFHPPIFGKEKAAVLANASLYIQASRWEGFSISIAEAMFLGTPCAIADTLDLATPFKQHNLGLVFSPNPQAAAAKLQEALNRPEVLQQWSDRARQFARDNFQPETVALNYLELYKEVVRNAQTR
jgi:glycosyltransferase involved in cell wall biosynthesis